MIREVWGLSCIFYSSCNISGSAVSQLTKMDHHTIVVRPHSPFVYFASCLIITGPVDQTRVTLPASTELQGGSAFWAIAAIGENVMECERPYRYLNRQEYTKRREPKSFGTGCCTRDFFCFVIGCLAGMQGRNSSTTRDEVVCSGQLTQDRDLHKTDLSLPNHQPTIKSYESIHLVGRFVSR